MYLKIFYMPKKNIDYSNTVIYKIFCKNYNITDIYVGHTTNFIKRKNQHRSVCIKNNSNTKVYKIINENGIYSIKKATKRDWY